MATVKPLLLPVRILAIVLICFLCSCNEKQEPGGGVRIPNPADTSGLAKIKHFISTDSIKKFREDFNIQRDSLGRAMPGLFIPVSETFNKKALLDLLKDSTNVGIRIYYGIKKGGARSEMRLILVGVNSQGQDLYYNEGGEASKVAAQLPPPPTQGGSEYGQCTPPCFQTGH